MDFLAGLLEPFHWQFMRNALLAVLVISPLFGLLSTMVVTSRMSFFSDALGHSAFTGIAIGTLCGLADPPVDGGAVGGGVCPAVHLCAPKVQYGQRHGHRRLFLHRRGPGYLYCHLRRRQLHPVQQPAHR